jgi:hypothetical protein
MEVRAELLQQVRLLEAESRASVAIDRDRERICQRCMELVDLLQDLNLMKMCHRDPILIKFWRCSNE